MGHHPSTLRKIWSSTSGNAHEHIENENALNLQRGRFSSPNRHGIWAIFRGTQVGSVEKTCSAKAWRLKLEGLYEKEEPGSHKNTFESNRQSQSFGGLRQYPRNSKKLAKWQVHSWKTPAPPGTSRRSCFTKLSPCRELWLWPGWLGWLGCCWPTGLKVFFHGTGPCAGPIAGGRTWRAKSLGCLAAWVHSEVRLWASWNGWNGHAPATCIF